MKFKFLQAEFEFDKDDAKIAVPLVLVGLGMAFTPIPKVWQFIGAVAYYVFLFFLTEPLKKLVQYLSKRWAYRCPHCRSHHTVELGLQDYLAIFPTTGTGVMTVTDSPCSWTTDCLYREERTAS
jgi:hypothetical protein